MADGGQATNVSEQRGLRVGNEPTTKCRICTWRMEDRLRLVHAHLEGASYRALAKQFPAGTTAIFEHLTKCEAANIARQKLHRHRAVDWGPILSVLAEAGEVAGASIQAGFETGDISGAMDAVDRLTDNVTARTALAQRLRDHEHHEIAAALREIAAHYTHADPLHAPAIIDAVLKDRPHARNAIEDVLKSSTTGGLNDDKRDD